jgi:hypothetical protein
MDNKRMENNEKSKVFSGKQRNGKQKWKTNLNTFLQVKL